MMNDAAVNALGKKMSHRTPMEKAENVYLVPDWFGKEKMVQAYQRALHSCSPSQASNQC